MVTDGRASQYRLRAKMIFEDEYDRLLDGVSKSALEFLVRQSLLHWAVEA